MREPAAESVPLRLTVNGRAHEVSVSAADTLLDVLHGRLRLTSCRETCGLGLCGSCTVTVDGRAVSACIAPAFTLDGAEVRTAEGLGTATELSDLQQAFVDEQAFQCSYCTPGFLMSATAMLEEGGECDLHEALGGHLCRCGSYRQIVAAVSTVLPAPDQYAADRPEPEEK
jgi:aerobic-type carbon monoxide dehydrogenase small subunit (CoxS/CutS family)